jgi:hypothetical protein
MIERNFEVEFSRNEQHKYMMNITSYHSTYSDMSLVERFLKKISKNFDTIMNERRQLVFKYNEAKPKEAEWNQQVIKAKFVNMAQDNATIYIICQDSLVSLYFYAVSNIGAPDSNGDDVSKALRGKTICFGRRGLFIGTKLDNFNFSNMHVYDNGEHLLSVNKLPTATEADIETVNRHFPLKGGCNQAALDAFRGEQDEDLGEAGRLLGFQIYLTPDMSGYELEAEKGRLRIFRRVE